jgi:hypothetical protein
MGRYEAKNNVVVRRGFKRLSTSKDRVIEAGMKDLMENAMLAALSFHDATHWLHKSTENSYGWCVLHDGRSVAVKTNEGRHGGGNAYQQLMAASRLVSQTGWVGILLASLEGDRPMYFAVNYEEWILLLTAQDIQQNWRLFFNVISGDASKLPM